MYLAQQGIPFEVIPGVSSAIAVPAYAGIPVTHRGCASSLCIATGHEGTHKTDFSLDWKQLAAVDTVVVLMGLTKLPQVVEQFLLMGKEPSTPIALISQGTSKFQETVVGTLADILQQPATGELKSPVAIVIGQVVSLREKLTWFR